MYIYEKKKFISVENFIRIYTNKCAFINKKTKDFYVYTHACVYTYTLFICYVYNTHIFG